MTDSSICMVSICFISTYLNHHNKPLCDALYSKTNGSFAYVSTSNIGELRKSMGFSQMEAEYLIDYANSSDREAIQKQIDDAEVVLISAASPISLIKNRLHEGALTFRCSERLFKSKSRYLKAPVHWMRCLLSRRAHLLCNGAATARDYNLLGFYKCRCYKWGYFTEVPKIDVEEIWDRKLRLGSSGISILWVGRLIRWKHPEVAIVSLNKMRESGYKFNLNIIGDGPESPKLRNLVDVLGMNDCVHLLGSKSTKEVRRYMEESEVFLFTSNREEGWGAVLNESMSCACAVVANSEIGSVPFLIKDGSNGLIYHNGSIDSLVDCLMPLFESESYRKRLGVEAYKTMSENWAPIKAAENLLSLIDSIKNRNDNPIKEGPCSVAY